MSYLTVERPDSPRPRRIWIELLALAVVLVALAVVTYAAFATVPVVVDGTPQRVSIGTRVEALARQGILRASPGDLVSAVGGAVLRPGGGEPVRVLVDGVPVAHEQRIKRSVEIESLPGEDVAEETVVTDEAIPIPVRYEGDGPIVSLTRTGSVGRRRVTRGLFSGAVVEMRVLEPAEPMVLARTRPSPSDRVVALTFDDSPWPDQTEAILEILADEKVPATFFMLGLQVRRHPQLAGMVRDAGHVIGNHTYRHPILRRSTKQEVRDEIDDCRDAIEDATGVTSEWFRPPGGLLSPSVHSVCREKGLQVVGWTVDPQDWSGKDAETLVRDTVSAVEPGAVVLLHDGGGDRSATMEALPEIIEILRERRYTFVTLERIAELARE